MNERDKDTDKMYKHECIGYTLYRANKKVEKHFYMSYNPEPQEDLCPLHLSEIERLINEHYPELKKSSTQKKDNIVKRLNDGRPT